MSTDGEPVISADERDKRTKQALDTNARDRELRQQRQEAAIGAGNKDRATVDSWQQKTDSGNWLTKLFGRRG